MTEVYTKLPSKEYNAKQIDVRKLFWKSVLRAVIQTT